MKGVFTPPDQSGALPPGGLPQDYLPETPPAPAPQGGQVGALGGGMESSGALAPIQATEEGGNEGYNGQVMVDGELIDVVQGMANVGGETYFVSDDGSFVVNRDQEVVGRVVDGQFIPIDDEYLEQLRSNGMLEE